MIRTLACALLAAIAPESPQEAPQAQPPPRDFVLYQEPNNGPFVYGATNGGTPWPTWMVAAPRDGGWSWDAWSRGPSSGLGLAKLDAATRAQLKVPEGRGLVATGVEESGPAWQAGLRDDDVLLALDDEPLAEPEDLERLLKKAGERPAALALIRKAKPTTIQVQPRIRAELGPVASRPPEFWIGASVSAVAPALRAQLDLPADRGLAVTELADGSPAAAAGLQVNDVILAVDAAPISDPAALREIVARGGDRPLALEFLRGGEKATLKVTPTKRQDGGAPPSTDVSFAADGIQFFSATRAGVVFQGDGQDFTLDQYRVAGKPDDAPASSAPKLDALAAEVKTLREAVEALRKAIEEKK